MRPIRICIPDNQNRYLPEDKLVKSTVNNNTHKKLLALSALSVWDLVDTGNVLMLSSFGKNTEENRNRKFIDLGLYNEIEKTQIVYTENVMGFLSYDDVEVNVFSRFDCCGHNFFLFHMLSKVCGASMAKLMASQSKINALDLLPLLFPKLLKDALHQGLFRAYRQYEYNDMRVKGRIDVSRHIRQNIPFRGTIAYSAREYDADNMVTQLIRHTIEYLRNKPMGKQALNCDQDTRAAVEMIVQATPSYDHKQFLSILQKNISKKVSHPYYNKYINLQQLCIAILQHKKAAYGGDGKQKIQGILFDGAWLWEEYIASLLKEQFMHYTESNSHFKLFEQDGGMDFQKIVPDYMTRDYDDTSGAGAQAVADAKYMRLEDKLRLQGEQAYSVYYKTIMYMHRFNAKKGFIFYPVAQDEKTSEDIGNANEDNKHNIFREYAIKNTYSKFIMAGLRIPSSGENLTFEKFQERMRDIETQYVEQIHTFLKQQ